MPRLFLSYARGDDEPFVERLFGALRNRGFDVWWDRACMPSRRLTFHQEIRDAVTACERLVLVLGAGAVASYTYPIILSHLAFLGRRFSSKLLTRCRMVWK